MTAPTMCKDATGFFGKLPSHGDFVARRLPAGFTGPWDAWLQAGMADSRAQLGKVWLPLYLNSPIWRFAVGAGVCGPQAWGGVLMPSVDRVGRYFPFTIAAGLDGYHVPDPAWYASLEALALPALSEGFLLEGFDVALLSLPPGGTDCTFDDLAQRALFWLADGAEPVRSTPMFCVDSLAPSLFSALLMSTSFN